MNMDFYSSCFARGFFLTLIHYDLYIPSKENKMTWGPYTWKPWTYGLVWMRKRVIGMEIGKLQARSVAFCQTWSDSCWGAADGFQIEELCITDCDLGSRQSAIWIKWLEWSKSSGERREGQTEVLAPGQMIRDQELMWD